MSLVGFGVGALGLGTGLYLLLSDGEQEDVSFQVRGVELSPRVSPWGFALDGRF